MRDFAFGPAVLAGLDLLRRRPLPTLGLALVGVAASFAGSAASVVSTHFVVTTFGRPNAAYVISTATAGVGLLAFLLVMSIIAAAVMRGRGVRLGGDELRLFILSLLVFLALAVVFLAIGVGAAIGTLGGLEAGWKDGVIFVSLGLAVVLVLGLASRLWLAGSMTVHDGRFRLMASWRLTRGRSWKVFGVFLTTLLMAVLVGVAGVLVMAKVLLALGLDTTVTYDPSLAVALKVVIQPARLVHVLLQGLLTGLAVVIQVAPAAYIHRRLAGDPVADQVAVFD